MLALLDLWRVRPELFMRLGYSLWISSDTARSEALIDQGVVDALVARDADISQNGEDSQDSGTGLRRQAPLAY
ncbi:hypothetical protein Tco_1462288, partial [Tanacetum coccineum]